jgi:dolichol-phosphate mannosyltransferase/undecaprenyl-phosphate 4-deoxy-4-formamido-L-arabinose transferase
MKLVSIVIPVYNSTASLVLLSERIKIVFQALDYAYELIFIDDKSPNTKSWEILELIAKKDTNVKIIQLTRNFGQQAATLCGIEYAKGDFVLTMDDDLQHSPEDIPLLLSQNKHDIVIGVFKSKKHSYFKRATSKIKAYFDYIIIGKPKGIQLSSFRLFNRIIVDGMLKIKTAYPFIPALMFYVSKDVIGVELLHYNRHEGKTNYNFLKLVKVFSNLIINNSSFLLKLIGQIGISISVINLIVACIIIYRKLFLGISVIGWASNMVALLFIGGLILFSLGIIGEYLIRIVSGIEQKPTYLIRKKENL